MVSHCMQRHCRSSSGRVTTHTVSPSHPSRLSHFRTGIAQPLNDELVFTSSNHLIATCAKPPRPDTLPLPVPLTLCLLPTSGTTRHKQLDSSLNRARALPQCHTVRLTVLKAHLDQIVHQCVPL